MIYGSTTLSTTNTTIPQPPKQPPTSSSYDPPPSPEYDTYTASSTFQQPSSSSNNISVTTHPYTQAQNASDPNIPTTFNIKMIHTNPRSNIVTSRTLSRPPIQTIPTKSLQNNLSSTKTHDTQHSIYSLELNTSYSNGNFKQFCTKS